MNKILGIIFLLFVSTNTFAGAWGVGSFENDAALDWAYDLEAVVGDQYLIDSLNEVFKHEYKDEYVCSNVIAASEVVASMKDGIRVNLPKRVDSWVSKNADIYKPEISKLAVKAIDECLNNESSELAQVWNDVDSTEWTSEVENLLQRLK